MKLHYSKYALGLVGLSAVLFSVTTMSCEIGIAEENQHGELLFPVSDVSGRLVGKIRQQHDGSWEAVVDGEGALNEQYFSIEQALDAVCANSEP